MIEFKKTFEATILRTKYEVKTKIGNLSWSLIQSTSKVPSDAEIEEFEIIDNEILVIKFHYEKLIKETEITNE